MKLRSMFMVVLGLQVCLPALAGSTFRCEVNGRVAFSDRPCQPVRQKAVCQESDGKALAREALQRRCTTPGAETGKAPTVPSAYQPAFRDVGPSRLALHAIVDGAASLLPRAAASPA